MKVQVLVRLKAGVLDVQGKAVEHGLQGIGFNEIANVRVGKLVELEISAGGEEEARSKAEEMCQKLLVNPIIENYEIRTIS
ncbi:MAG: phosphoribosylformylglycinamidine synthase subunit PurS [Deltaproteobacteria bacterium]|nr:phosphoribosylformylglycinamidine synthase subunit PurS [Deltaproteobacteria bacterium]